MQINTKFKKTAMNKKITKIKNSQIEFINKYVCMDILVTNKMFFIDI